MQFTEDNKHKGIGVLKVLSTLNSLARTVISLAILAAIAVGGWFAYQTFFAEKWEAQRELQALTEDLASKDREIKQLSGQIGVLERDVEAKQKEIERLDMAMRLLKVDKRVARIDVLSQQGSVQNGDLVTHFTFVELDKDKEDLPLDEPRLFSVRGDVIYIDALVVKFDDQYVEAADPLRSTSLCLFRRVFGENQKPADGFVLDPVGSRPAAYQNGREPSKFEQQIWARFWQYANDPELAKKTGIRAAHGEAPYLKVVPGKRYKMELRASGGLSFELPEDLPPEAQRTPVAETL